jgi:hypothetical protein
LMMPRIVDWSIAATHASNSSWFGASKLNSCSRHTIRSKLARPGHAIFIHYLVALDLRQNEIQTINMHTPQLICSNISRTSFQAFFYAPMFLRLFLPETDYTIFQFKPVSSVSLHSFLNFLGALDPSTQIPGAVWNQEIQMLHGCKSSTHIKLRTTPPRLNSVSHLDDLSPYSICLQRPRQAYPVNHGTSTPTLQVSTLAVFP